MTSSLGPNRHLIGREAELVARELSTPALMVDLNAFEANLLRMADLVGSAGRKVRPHAKAHKSSLVGKRQLDAGAVGLCCATVREAEVLGEAGLSGLLVTTPVVTPSMVSRLTAVAEQADDLMVVVDSLTGVEIFAEYARPGRPIGILIDIDMGLGRDGLVEPAEAVALARRIDELPQLTYRGVQAYYGHLQHVKTLTDRHAKIAEQWDNLVRFLEALSGAGFAPEIISGGGTGTHHLDLAHGPFTEIQPGSYLFMDKQYGEVEIAPGGSPFATSLTVAARVVSTAQPDRVIVDAGSKALSTDYGPALVVKGAPEGATYQFMGDEHGAIRMPEGANRPPLGGIIELVAPHCDPTANLHDRFHVMQGGRLVDIWPIEARGY
ncbi:MAG: DSD1 family PLP-dependent enzyme [Bauldia sp.]|uniref:DSD1 family PLP-dependent enzyme n=1 Tax=Bauldia sp. TaxID=2575872 RepID=UPI001DC269EA|nr:DSD1 family PLP-dependent enzyme [Bauldia sp.]MCB1497842.1 DSD1 family PLP-dependent enzyme [Bauldia sp.]